MNTYTLTVVAGECPFANGWDIGESESPISYRDLDPDTRDWLESSGFTPDRPDIWVLVTPGDEDPAAVNVIATRTVTA